VEVVAAVEAEGEMMEADVAAVADVAAEVATVETAAAEAVTRRHHHLLLLHLWTLSALRGALHATQRSYVQSIGRRLE
jgi:hypothetical protein